MFGPILFRCCLRHAGSELNLTRVKYPWRVNPNLEVVGVGTEKDRPISNLDQDLMSATKLPGIRTYWSGYTQHNGAALDKPSIVGVRSG